MADYTNFRLGPQTLADLDALAASAGTRTQALREAIAHWRQAVAEAGRLNADELSADDWTRLAHLNDVYQLDHSDGDRSAAWDWSQRLAHELVGVWEGRPVLLPLHREEADACRDLARRVAALGPVRGYALMSALRHFWRDPARQLPERWWEPEVWMGGAD